MGMKTLGKRNLSLTLLTLLIAGMFIITGCSGGGGGATSGLTGGDTGGDTGGGDTGDTNPYSGGATISGKIDVDSLSSADQALLSKAVAGKALSKMSAKETKAYRQRYAASFTEDAVAKLYVVDEDGSLEDTGISGELAADENGDPTYTFDEVADGVNYVVRYLKLVSDGQVLELKANAYVPEGETAPEGGTVDVSPKTTVIVQALVDAILNATSGTGISQTIVNNIITAVKNAIVALVDAGLIQIPSMVVEASGSDITTIAAGETTNDKLANTSGLLLSDESVDSELGAVKTETLAARFDLSSVTTDAAKEALIVRVFDEMMKDDSGDGGVPNFMLEFFKDIYVNNAIVTVDELMFAIGDGLRFHLPPGVTSPEISKDEAIDAFRAELTNIYILMSKETLSEDEKKDLATVPPVIMGLFPISERSSKWEGLTGDTDLNVPQGIAMTIYVVDHYLTERFSELQADYSGKESEDGGVSMEKEELIDFDPMAPGSLMDLLGFYDVYQNYDGIDIFGLWLHPGRAWIETSLGNGGEVDMLEAGSCMTDVVSMVERFTNPDPDAPQTDAFANATVTLTYPTATGTGEIELVNESDLNDGPQGGGMGETCFVLNPWREVQDSCVQGQPCQPNADRVVSNFVTGNYTVTVAIDGETVATKTIYKKVITGMTDAAAKLVTPRGYPVWPGNNATAAERAEFEAEMAAFNTAGGEERFSAAGDSDGDGTYDAKITVTWTAPTVTLPAGVKMGYHLDVGKGKCENNVCTWEHIYSTWEHNKLLYTTSFTIPAALERDDTTPYQLNVNVTFVDSTTGEELGQGSNTHAQFWVAEPLNTNLPFTIRGTAVNGYKVVLLRETEDKTSLTNRFTREAIAESDVVEGSYTLTPTIAAFVDYPGAWFNIIMYQDTIEDGEYTPSTSGGPGDMEIWPDWNSTTYHIWFNAWGGMLRVGMDDCSTEPCQHTEKMILGGETVEGPVLTLPAL